MLPNRLDILTPFASRTMSFTTTEAYGAAKLPAPSFPGSLFGSASPSPVAIASNE